MLKIKSPLITFLIPTYRRPQLLKRAIQSCLNQTLSDFQICIYDDRSQDETANLVKEFSSQDSRIQYFENPYNEGCYNNLKKSIQNVNTPYFCLLSDDDIILPNFSTTTLAGFRKYPQAFFSVGQAIIMSHNGHVIYLAPSGWKKKQGFFPPPQGIREFLGGKLQNYPSFISILFKKDIIKNGIYWNLIGGLPSEMDYFIGIASHFPFCMSCTPVGIATLHLSNYSGAVSIEQKCLSGFELIKKVLKNGYKMEYQTQRYAGKMLKKQITDGLCRLALQGLTNQSSENANKIANFLDKKLNQKATAKTLHRLIALSSKHDEKFFKLFNQLRDTLHQDIPHSKILQEKYGAYSKYLAL